MPGVSQHWCHSGSNSLFIELAHGLHPFPSVGNSFINSQVMSNTVLNLFDKALQILLQLDWDVLHVKLPFIGIAQDRRGAVVSRHDDKTVWRIENVKGGIIARSSIGSHELQVFRALQERFHIGIHELHCNLTGGIHINGIGFRSKSGRHQKQHQGRESVFHIARICLGQKYELFERKPKIGAMNFLSPRLFNNQVSLQNDAYFAPT